MATEIPRPRDFPKFVKFLGAVPLVMGGLLLFGAVRAAFDGEFAQAMSMTLFATPFTLLGMGLVGLGKDVTVERRLIERTHTLFGRGIQSDTMRAAEGADVSLRKEVRGSGKHRRWVYVVELENDDRAPVEVDALPDQESGRRFAMALAVALEADWVDRLGDKPVRRLGHQLGVSLSKRLQEQPAVPLPPAPIGNRALWSLQDDGFVLELPAPGLGGRHLWPVIASVIALAYLGVGVVVAITMEMPGAVVGPAIIAFFVLRWGIRRIRTTLATTRVALTDGSLRWSQSLGSWSAQEQIPLDDLQALEINDIRGQSMCVARSSTRTLSFGQELSSEERTWAMAQLEWALRHGS